MDNIARLSWECFFETMIKCNFISKSVIYYTRCFLYFYLPLVTLYFQFKIIMIENLYIFFFCKNIIARKENEYSHFEMMKDMNQLSVVNKTDSKNKLR